MNNMQKWFSYEIKGNGKLPFYASGTTHAASFLGALQYAIARCRLYQKEYAQEQTLRVTKVQEMDFTKK